MNDLVHKVTPSVGGNSDRVVELLRGLEFKKYVETQSDVAKRLGVLIDHVKTNKHDTWVKDPRFAFFGVGREEGTHNIVFYPSFGPNGRAAEFVSRYLPDVDPSLPPEEIYALALVTYFNDLSVTYKLETAHTPERTIHTETPHKKRTIRSLWEAFMS